MENNKNEWPTSDFGFEFPTDTVEILPNRKTSETTDEMPLLAWKQLLKRHQKDPGLLNVLSLALSCSEKRGKATQLAEISPEAFVEITGVKIF
jgi:hypothetical protein